MSSGVFGGIFDPPHNGHVALLRGAEEQFDFDRVLVFVVAEPGHRTVHATAQMRLSLARLAFPDYDVEPDGHARTVDLLRARQLGDPILLIGADELLDFPNWKEPETVLKLARLGVAARPGYARETLEPVRAGLSRPDRVRFFDIAPIPISSSEIRALVAAGKPIDGLLPHAVAEEIERLGLYR